VPPVTTSSSSMASSRVVLCISMLISVFMLLS
jgi:hypothetical protein